MGDKRGFRGKNERAGIAEAERRKAEAEARKVDATKKANKDGKEYDELHERVHRSVSDDDNRIMRENRAEIGKRSELIQANENRIKDGNLSDAEKQKREEQNKKLQAEIDDLKKKNEEIMQNYGAASQLVEKTDTENADIAGRTRANQKDNYEKEARVQRDLAMANHSDHVARAYQEFVWTLCFSYPACLK